MSKITRSANGEQCTVRLDGCLWDQRVVLAHLRKPGDGTGRKPPDYRAVYACGHCHDVIGDGTEARLERLGITKFVLRGLQETHERLFEKELLVEA